MGDFPDLVPPFTRVATVHDTTSLFPQPTMDALDELFGGDAASVPDATPTVKGIVQLAGDLAGTATAPTVPGLAGKAPTVHTHAAADITSGVLATARLGTGTADATKVLAGDGTWKTPSASGGTGVTPWLIPPVGATVAPFGITNSTNNSDSYGTTLGEFSMTPIVVPFQMTIDNLTCEVGVADPATTVALGLWDSDPLTGLPKNYLTGGQFPGASTGANAVTVSRVLAPGVYWTSLAASSRAVLRVTCVRAMAGAALSAFQPVNAVTAGTAPRWAVNGGPWNAPANAGGFGYGLPDWTPWVGVRRSA